MEQAGHEYHVGEDQEFGGRETSLDSKYQVDFFFVCVCVIIGYRTLLDWIFYVVWDYVCLAEHCVPITCYNDWQVIERKKKYL